MDKQRLDEIRAREEAATEGPWEWPNGRNLQNARGNSIVYCVHFIDSVGALVVDADFLEHARADIPDLLAYVDELEEIEQIYKRGNENYEKRIRELHEQIDDAPIGYGYEE